MVAFAGLLGFLALGPAHGAANAQDIVYDQKYTPQETSCSWSVRILAPVGQEFVPRVSRLDLLDLFLLNQDSTMPLPALVWVRIHRDSIAGALVGTSRRATVPFDNWAPVRFEFEDPIPTDIGSMYAIEVVAEPGTGNVAIAAGPNIDLYPPGKGVVGGVRLQMADMWFRTGIRRVAVDPTTWGNLKQLYRD